jgi:DNA-binding GntR family transcriptional regulator
MNDLNAQAEPLAVERRVLHVEVAHQLRRMIVEGDLAPGTRLNERVLCEQLSVSRTPLREAFKVLAGDGLIALLPNRGAEVLRLSAEMVVQAFEVMANLEALSGELACRRITEPQLAEIRALHFEMLASHARRDLPAYFKLNQRIHEAINAAARNEILRETYLRINLRIQALRFRTNVDVTKWDLAVLEHVRMMQALERRDSAALAALLKQHLQHKLNVVLSELREETDAAVPSTA